MLSKKKRVVEEFLKKILYTMVWKIDFKITRQYIYNDANVFLYLKSLCNFKLRLWKKYLKKYFEKKDKLLFTMFISVNDI